MMSFAVVAPVVIAVLLAVGARSEQLILLDTTSESSLAWPHFPNGPLANSTGWKEEQYTNFEKKINWRTYSVCDVAHSNVENWLWTPFIIQNVTNRIYIEIKYTIRDCLLFPGSALNCKDTIHLLLHETDDDVREPPLEPENYKPIGILSTGENRSEIKSDVDIQTEVKSVAVIKKGVFFAFRDNGACANILAVKVYYNICPELTISYAWFPVTPTGRSTSGTCVENAEITPGENTPYLLCKENGKWLLSNSSCKCQAGFEPDHVNQRCNECAPGMFKSYTGDDLCIACPDNSEATAYAATECKCVPGYFRAKKDPINGPCTKPPLAPQNPMITFSDEYTLDLGWQPPLDTGGRNDVTYRVQCLNCGADADYITSSGLEVTRVHINGLYPSTKYKFQVFAENGVSDLAKTPPSKVEILAMTEDDGSEVTNVTVFDVESDKLSLTWDLPRMLSVDPSNKIKSYEVMYFPKNDLEKNVLIKRIKESQVTLDSLSRETEYGIRVRAKINDNWGPFSGTVYAKTTLGLQFPNTSLKEPFLNSTQPFSAKELAFEFRLLRNEMHAVWSEMREFRRTMGDMGSSMDTFNNQRFNDLEHRVSKLEKKCFEAATPPVPSIDQDSPYFEN